MNHSLPKNSPKHIASAALCLLASFCTYPQMVNAAGEETRAFVLQEGSAWKELAPGTYASVNKGATFREDETIWSGQGAFLSDGKNVKNMIVLKGEAKLEQLNEDRITIDLKRGKVFAILDDLGGQPFKVQTPMSVAAVRGTRFKVERLTNATEATTFAGEVRMSLRRPSDGIPTDSTLLTAGRKTRVTDEPRKLQSSELADPMDMQEWSGLTAAYDELLEKFQRGESKISGIQNEEVRGDSSSGYDGDDEDPAEDKYRRGNVVF